MANSSANSSGSARVLKNSDSSTELQVIRKKRRMESNRESARRSRMRKQKHLNDLVAQVTQLKKDNSQILTNINVTTQRFLNVEADNSILNAQIVELRHRLDSLNDIIRYIDTASVASTNIQPYSAFAHHRDLVAGNRGLYLSQPILASHDLFLA